MLWVLARLRLCPLRNPPARMSHMIVMKNGIRWTVSRLCSCPWPRAVQDAHQSTRAAFAALEVVPEAGKGNER